MGTAGRKFWGTDPLCHSAISLERKSFKSTRCRDSSSLYSEMLKFKEDKVNGYFDGIMIGPLLFPPKSYFICFPVQKTDLQNTIYKEKTPSFPVLLRFPGSMPLIQPLTSPPIFQALFFSPQR